MKIHAQMSLECGSGWVSVLLLMAFCVAKNPQTLSLSRFFARTWTYMGVAGHGFIHIFLSGSFLCPALPTRPLEHHGDGHF